MPDARLDFAVLLLLNKKKMAATWVLYHIYFLGKSILFHHWATNVNTMQVFYPDLVKYNPNRLYARLDFDDFMS